MLVQSTCPLKAIPVFLLRRGIPEQEGKPGHPKKATAAPSRDTQFFFALCCKGHQIEDFKYPARRL